MADFRIDQTKRTFTIVLGGFAQTDKAANFVDDLKSSVATIPAQDYALIVDSEELKTFKPEILPVLEKSYALYMSLGFRKIIMINPKRVTPRLQLKRIARNCGFTGQFVTGKEEALSIAIDQ